MTIPLVGPSSLFQRLADIGCLLHNLNNFSATTFIAAVNQIIADYAVPDAQGQQNDEQIIDGIQQQITSEESGILTIAPYLQALAQDTLNWMVYLDTPLSSNTSVQLSMTELIRQMKLNSQNVLEYTLGATVGTSTVTNGDGVCVVSTVDASGLSLQNMIAETLRVQVTADSTSSASLAGNERFQALGAVAENNVLAADWPLGSGGRASLSAINPTANNSQGNLLYNSDFEAWTASTPNNWTIKAGASQISKSTAQHYTGSASMQWAGDGSTHTEIVQPFAATTTTGTPATLTDEAVYQFAVLLKVDVVPAAGVVEIALVDDNDNVVKDAQGVNQAVTQSLTGFTANTWAVFTGSLRTPYEMPSEIQLRVRLSTGISSGTNLFVDHLGFGQAVQLYVGSPWLSVFSGSLPFYIPDFFTVTTTNNRPASLTSWQVLFDRLFGMRQMGLLLPYSASPTIADTIMSCGSAASSGCPCANVNSISVTITSSGACAPFNGTWTLNPAPVCVWQHQDSNVNIIAFANTAQTQWEVDCYDYNTGAATNFVCPTTACCNAVSGHGTCGDGGSASITLTPSC